MTLNTSVDSQFIGALGAALFALDHVLAEKRDAPDVHAEPAVWMDE